jgi:hypothetical protein
MVGRSTLPKAEGNHHAGFHALNPWRLISCLPFLIAFCAAPASAAPMDGAEAGLPIEKVADLISSIVAANREAYSQIVVNRLMIQEKIISADEAYLKKKLLPLPAQFFRASAEAAAGKNTRAVYSLESFWSIRPQNFPKTEAEKIGLARVLGGIKHFYGIEAAGGPDYFVATYPDLATNEACVRCHNGHPDSRRRDFQLGDVMGGVVVRIPISAAASKGAVEMSATKPALNPDLPIATGIGDTIPAANLSFEETADLVNSVVSANREVYANLVVARLVQEHLMALDEQYLAKKCLPLPEQLFNIGAMLAASKTGAASFALRSAAPLNQTNLPSSELEKQGLAAISEGKDRFYGVETAGSAKTFVAVYPDKASSEACASCHNGHPNATRRDYKAGSVLGGIAVRIPISQ